jgi:hypothetical protein
MKQQFIFLCIFLNSFCFSQKNKMNVGNYTFDIECHKNNFDGTLVLKSFGLSNLNYKEALLEAKKRALYQIIFEGVSKGASDCVSLPILNDLNAKSKHEAYFNKFFKKNGEFNKYVEIKPSTNNNKDKVFYLTIKKSDLKAKLEEDGILKS